MATNNPTKSVPSPAPSGAGAKLTMQRHWCMLRNVPAFPRKITAAELCSLLKADSFAVTKRTVERDLQELSRLFPLVSDEREKPFGWSWKKDAPRLDLPGLDPSEALTLLMVERHLETVLPAATRKRLKPHFDLARNALKGLPGDHTLGNWLDKVRILPPAQPLIPPKLKGEVEAAIHDALLQEKQLEIRYRQKGAEKDSTATIHPLAIVQRGVITYLICTFYTYTDLRLLTLHRISKAELTDVAINRPPNFSVDDLINSGMLGFRKSEPTLLVADFFNGAGEHLFETPLAANQKLDRLPSAVVRLTANVPLSPETVWWLLSFGDHVEVKEPQTLRREIASRLREAANRYD